METFQKKITDYIDNVIIDYIQDVSVRYKLPKQELQDMWMKKDGIRENKVDDEDSNKKYSKMKKTELVSICESKKLNSKGTKQELINRIIKKEVKGEDIVEKLDMSLNSIVIKKNKFGNYLHSPTKFVFNKDTKCVIGKEIENGEVLSLDANDIDICNKYKFKYVMPDDLNVNKNNEDDEDIIDDDDDDMSEDDEEDEEEEEEDED